MDIRIIEIGGATAFSWTDGICGFTKEYMDFNKFDLSQFDPSYVLGNAS